MSKHTRNTKRGEPPKSFRRTTAKTVTRSE